MVVIAEGFLQSLEKQALYEALNAQPPINIKSYHRFVDDSHARVPELDHAERFKEILNKQDEHIKYTIEVENDKKELEFLDIKVINNMEGKYEFKVHRKDAITNVHLKPASSHDPRVLKSTFAGFVNRAFSICSEKYLDEELNFLTEVFVENGYKENELNKIVNQVKTRYNQPNANKENRDNEYRQMITLPWIPGLSPKLRKVYKKAGIKVVFKAGASLKTLLTAKNKTRLPKNSFPGVYKIPCSKHPDKNPYIGETKLKINTRLNQHYEDVTKEKMKRSGVIVHSGKCDGDILWENATTVKVESNRFNRKVREALEIQYNDSEPTNGGMNLDNGQYVTTKFWKPMFKYLKGKQSKQYAMTSVN